MDHLVFRVYAIRRMFQRSISEEHVRHVLETGEVIQRYPDDQPYPSRLILGWQGTRPIHVVIADNVEDQEIVVITVYEPDLAHWQADFRRERP